jgi:hypothetical protein
MIPWTKYSQEDEQAYLATAKRIHKMVRPRSPLLREYIEDPQDPELIHIIISRKKTGEWVGSSMIIDTHLCTWLDHDISQGWIDELQN